MPTVVAVRTRAFPAADREAAHGAPRAVHRACPVLVVCRLPAACRVQLVWQRVPHRVWHLAQAVSPSPVRPVSLRSEPLAGRQLAALFRASAVCPAWLRLALLAARRPAVSWVARQPGALACRAAVV